MLRVCPEMSLSEKKKLVPVMSTLIYQQGMSLLNWPFGAAIGFTMLATILTLFMLTSGLARRERGA